ncbi:hypothetical protein [Prauserella cavernicola]|uniref:ABM domain-containing protein n=1 Tax=Prauserella cavernicola TaxID=2800127 RepID=A0A934QXZ2_9PSEU|nr:hypothetical protein [Prauserella cavernicola]MBK1787579.1 hypothetical protein [Prauserella cavernicola]
MSTALPVTVVVSRTACGPGGAALTRWAHELCRDAAGFPGHLGAHVDTRIENGDTTVHIGVTFAGAAELLRWERSGIRARRLAEGDALTHGEPVALGITELVPAATSGPPPSRVRSAVLIWAALFPPAAVVNATLMPHLDAWPGIVRTLLLTLLLVPIVVLGTLPLLQRVLRRWSR